MLSLSSKLVFQHLKMLQSYRVRTYPEEHSLHMENNALCSLKLTFFQSNEDGTGGQRSISLFRCMIYLDYQVHSEKNEKEGLH